MPNAGRPKRLFSPRCELFQQRDKVVSGYHPGAQGFEVFGIDLAVDEPDPFFTQLVDIADKGVFARIAHGAEHAFPEEHLTQPDAVEAPYELAILPGLRTVRIAGVVEPGVGSPDLIGDPGAFLASAGDALAIGDHAGEIGVDAELEDIPFEQLFHAFTFAELAREKHKTGIRAPPKDMLSFVPGKDALTIGKQQALRRQITAYSQQPVRLSKRHRRKDQFGVKDKKWH